jgi:hypothetical protein
MINAIGPFASEKFSSGKVGTWANQVIDAAGIQITSISAKEHSSASAPSSTEKHLLSDAKSLYNDAVVLENDAAGNSHGKVAGALSSVTGDIKHVYTDCGQTMP